MPGFAINSPAWPAAPDAFGRSIDAVIIFRARENTSAAAWDWAGQAFDPKTCYAGLNRVRR
jgi:hypothetical protein